MFPSADVLQVIEHPLRELDAAEVTGLALGQHGYRLRLASAIHSAHRLLLGGARVVVSPWAYGDHEYDYIFGFADAIQSDYGRVVLWQEQVTFDGAEQFFGPVGRSLETDAVHVAWGARFAEYLQSRGVPAHRIHQLGSPRLDLLHDRFASALPSRAHLARRHGLDSRREWILFPCSFGIAFLLPSIRQLLIDQGLQDVDAMEAAGRRSYQEFLDLVARLARETGDRLQIIVRPHPSESKDVYESCLGHLPGVAVTKEWSIAPWLRAADRVFVTTSTTALEAALIRKPVGVVQDDRNQSPRFDFTEFFPQVDFRMAPGAFLAAADARATAAPRLKDYLQHTFGPFDGQAHVRVAALLASLCERYHPRRVARLPWRPRQVKELARDLAKEALLRSGPLGPVLAGAYYLQRRTDLLTARAVREAGRRYAGLAGAAPEGPPGGAGVSVAPSPSAAKGNGTSGAGAPQRHATTIRPDPLQHPPVEQGIS